MELFLIYLWLKLDSLLLVLFVLLVATTIGLLTSLGNRLRHSPRGFTVLVAPHADREIAVSIAQCAAKDEFVKKQGRSYADDALPLKINPRDLPRLLGGLQAECWGQKPTIFNEHSYLYTLKYVV